MTKTRIEAFSDGVIAIIITIMVLELKVPHGDDLATLTELLPIFLCYVLSFANVGIYWNNHHHLFHAVKHVGGWVLWANLHLLFWLSLIPFVTGFLGENGVSTLTVVVYAFDLLMCALRLYAACLRACWRSMGENRPLPSALGSDLKGKLSLASYAIAIPLAFWQPLLSLAIIAVVALLWIVPDRRFAKVDHNGDHTR